MPRVLPWSSAPTKRLAVPLPRLHRPVCGRDVAHQGQHQGEGVLGRREQIRGRRVDHQDAEVGRLGDVDVVDPDARPRDHPQALALFEQIRGQLGGAADHDRVVIPDHLRETGLVLLAQPVDLMSGALQKLESRLMKRVRHQDPAPRFRVVSHSDLNSLRFLRRSVRAAPLRRSGELPPCGRDGSNPA